MRHLKILVIGTQGTGKTTIIHRVTKNTVSTDVNGCTVCLDYGILEAKSITAHFFGSPGLPQFELVRKALSNGSDGVLLVVDSTQPSSIKNGEQYLRKIFGQHLPPIAVAANKQDKRNALSPKQIERLLTIAAPVYPTQATKGIGLEQLLTSFIRHLLQLGKGYNITTLLAHS